MAAFFRGLVRYRSSFLHVTLKQRNFLFRIILARARVVLELIDILSSKTLKNASMQFTKRLIPIDEGKIVY